MTLGVIGVVYGSITTMRQTDLKRVIAYSSVAHMGVVQVGIFSKTVIGIIGSIYLQIAHGLVSGGLFIVVTWLYERYGTRLIRYYRGIVLNSRILIVVFLLLTLANIGVRGTCNFIGEIVILMGIYESNVYVGVLCSLGMVLGAGYSLYLYNRVMFGGKSRYLRWGDEEIVRDIDRREWYVIIRIVLWVLVLGIYRERVLGSIEGSILELIG